MSCPLLRAKNCHVFRDSTNVLRDLGDFRRMCAFFHIPIISISLAPFTFSFKLQISRFLPADIVFGGFCNLKKSLYMFVAWVELRVKSWLFCFCLDLLFQSRRFEKLPVYITINHIIYRPMWYVTRRLRNRLLEIKLRLGYLALLCHLISVALIECGLNHFSRSIIYCWLMSMLNFAILFALLFHVFVIRLPLKKAFLREQSFFAGSLRGGN